MPDPGMVPLPGLEALAPGERRWQDVAASPEQPAPQRIQLKRTKGWRMPANTVVVSRPSMYGNPFTVAETFDRDHELWPVLAASVPGGVADLTSVRIVSPDIAVALYSVWFFEVPALLLNARDDLGGKNLACWCRPGRPCHGDWLLGLVAGLDPIGDVDA